MSRLMWTLVVAALLWVTCCVGVVGYSVAQMRAGR